MLVGIFSKYTGINFAHIKIFLRTKFLNDNWMAERDFMDLDKELAEQNWSVVLVSLGLFCENIFEIFSRWWNVKVNQLPLLAPVTVNPHITCQDAIDIMDREGFDQLPVVDESG